MKDTAETPFRLVFATRNAGKLVELRRLLALHVAVPIEVLTLDEAGVTHDVEEDGARFVDNACKKALEIAQATGMWALGDDSGLEVDALGGAPGIHSARYAGVHGDDAANRRKLLEAMANERVRTARFRCVLALARPSQKSEAGAAQVVAIEEGCCEGDIVSAPRGSGGFGYDPLFCVPSLGRTMAELAPDEKHRISHRGQAMAKMAHTLSVLAAQGALCSPCAVDKN